jgi:hypothetical protein
MAYFQIPDATPKPAPLVPQARALGDLRGWSDPISVPGLGSVSPLTLALIGTLGMFTGVYVYRGLQHATQRAQRARSRARRKERQMVQKIGALGKQAIEHQTPTWQTLLLVGVAGAAVYFITKAVTKQA